MARSLWQRQLRKVGQFRIAVSRLQSRAWRLQDSSLLAFQSKLDDGYLERHLPLFDFQFPRGHEAIRSFTAAVDVQKPPIDPDLELENDPAPQGVVLEKPDDASSAPPVIQKKVKKEKLRAETAIHLFFERMKVVEKIVSVLKEASWCDETEKALQDLSITYTPQLITQVLRVSLPIDVALRFFNWLKAQDGFKHNEFTYGALLNLLGRGKHFSEMRDVLAEMKAEGCTISPVITSCVMHWYASVGNASGVGSHWHRLKHTGTKPSSGIYTAYLDYLIRTKRFTKIPHVYETMLSEECLPNSRTYTLLIQHLSNDGRLRAAVQILEIMQKVQVVPSRLAYEYIIEGYAKAGEVDKVQEILMAMRERFHRPSKRLMFVAKVLQEAGKVKEADELKEEIGLEEYIVAGKEAEGGADDVLISEDGDSMLESVMCSWRDATSPNVGFDVNSFAQAINAWSLEVEAELEKLEVQWKSSLVLEVLRRLRNLETSWPFFHWVKNRAGFKHDKYTCMVMIQRILKSRSSLDTTSALVDELFEGMQKDGIKFTVPMFNMMIRHYVLAADIERAQGMFDRIKAYGLEPNAFSYGPLIQALARDRQGRKAMNMLEQMQEAGFHPDSATCAELITCLELAEKLPDAYEFFCKIPESGRNPGHLEYKAIMAAYSRAGDQKMALNLYEKMRGAGIKPTQDMFDDVSVILKNANRQYDINTIANFRQKLKFFGGKKKALQEDLLKVLDFFMRAMKPRPNNAYASLRNANKDVNSDKEVTSDAEDEDEVDSSVVLDTETNTSATDAKTSDSTDCQTARV